MTPWCGALVAISVHPLWLFAMTLFSVIMMRYLAKAVCCQGSKSSTKGKQWKTDDAWKGGCSKCGKDDNGDVSTGCRHHTTHAAAAPEDNHRVEVTRIDVLQRPKLKPSTNTKRYLPDNGRSCDHPVLLPRGNQSRLWFTCATCPSRWPRNSVDEVVSE